ncbi:MAG: choice-of-anchor D domain-containing protein [Melioribacteraceae bacterium]|nr:choice-of-anchor D domain-containing protein [Melioribacteraceae bacterium]
MKKFITILFFISTIITAQNLIGTGNYSGAPAETITIAVNVTNADPFTALQTDIKLPSQVKYVDNSIELSSRASAHNISASLQENNTLRVIIFSVNQTNVTGTSGDLFSFRVTLKTDPGNYNLELLNTVIANASSQNIFTGSENGSIAIIAPDIYIDQSELNYGRLPLRSSSTMQIYIVNQGTSDLVISRLYTDNNYYVIEGDTAFTVPAGNSRMVSVRFNSIKKGEYNSNLFILSNDAGTPRSIIALKAIAFAVNEIHLQRSSGRAGTIIDVKLTLNNMEDFTGFQFDINLPSVSKYEAGGATLSERKNDHIISANIVQGNKLRVIAYSPTNKSFADSVGEICSIKFLLDGSGGWYSTNIESAFITNNKSENIISATTGEYIIIDAPDISGEQSVNIGSNPITDTLVYNYYISNWGSDTLKINSLQSSNPEFWFENSSPFYILPSQNHLLKIKFRSLTKGNKSSIITVRNNDPDEEPFIINLSASSFVPNFLKVRDAEILLGANGSIFIDADNYEAIYALQFDIQLPDSFKNPTFILTDRKQDHAIASSILNANTYRIIAYSLSMKPFLANTGAIVEIRGKAGNALGSYQIDIKNSVMSNSSSQNIIQSEIDGKIIFKKGVLSKPVNYSTGWNMISIPIIEADMSKEKLFPSIANNAFAFNNGYTVAANLSNGIGYWLKFPAPNPKNFIGTIDEEKIINVVQGWNMIGCFESDINISEIYTDPADIIATNFYSFGDGYVKSILLEPGKGYWIKVFQNGTLDLSQRLPPKTSLASIREMESAEQLPSIVFRNAKGKSAELTILNNSSDALEKYELPPLPPSGIFDVRFSSNRFAEVLSSGQWQQVLISSLDYPVTVSLSDIILKIRDGLGGERILCEGESFVITNPAINKIEIASFEIPAEFALMQNYPNPFNPTTTIKFALPENGRVVLSIYNVLGERMAEIINSQMDAGYHEINWNASSLGSGVYIYSLQAGEFHSIKKMILMK